MKQTEETTIMQLPKKLHAAASTDQTRVVLHAAMIDAEKRLIVTTNGRIMCAIPIPGEAAIKPGFITPEMLNIAKARNKKSLDYDYAAGTVNGEAIVTPEDFIENLGNYPNYQQAIPTDLPVYRIFLDPKYIQAIADGFGGTDAGLTFELPQDGMCPSIIRQGEKFAVIMPMRGDKDSGLLVASDADAEKLRSEIASLRKALDAAKSERSDNNPGHSSDDAMIQALRTEMLAARARVKELESILASPHTTTGNAIPADPKPKDKSKREVGLAIGPPVLTRNEKRNGIELRFNGKPDPDTHAKLLARKWKWAPGQPGQPWYCKYSEEQWVFAHSLAESTTPAAMPEEIPANVTPMPAAPSGESRLRKISITDF